MKRFSLLTTVFIISVSASAQTAIIPRLGISSTKFGLTESRYSESHKIGYVGGVAFQFRSQKHFSIQPEIYYIGKGANVDQVYSSSSEDDGSILEEHVLWDVRVSYIEIPLLAKFSFGGKKLKVFFDLGPSIAFALGGKYDAVYSLTTRVDGESESYPIAMFDGDVSFVSPPYIGNEDKNIYMSTKTDICAQLGLGFLIANKITLDARFGFSVKQSSVRSALQTIGVSVAQQAFQFTAGVPLRLRQKSE